MAKEVAAAKPKAEKKAAEPKKNFITTKHLADKLGTKPAALRRWLRTLPSFKDGTYTRYKWDPENNKADAQFLKDAEASYKKHKEVESEKNKKRLAEVKAKAKAEGNGKAKAKKGKAEPEEEEEEVEEEEEELG